MDQIKTNALNNNTNNIPLARTSSNHILGNCRSVSDFEKIEEVGEGTYGRVCKCH